MHDAPAHEGSVAGAGAKAREGTQPFFFIGAGVSSPEARASGGLM